VLAWAGIGVVPEYADCVRVLGAGWSSARPWTKADRRQIATRHWFGG